MGRAAFGPQTRIGKVGLLFPHLSSEWFREGSNLCVPAPPFLLFFSFPCLSAVYQLFPHFPVCSCGPGLRVVARPGWRGFSSPAASCLACPSFFPHPYFFVFLPLEASESWREGGWLFPEFLAFPPASRYWAEEIKILWSASPLAAQCFSSLLGDSVMTKGMNFKVKSEFTSQVNHLSLGDLEQIFSPLTLIFLIYK